MKRKKRMKKTGARRRQLTEADLFDIAAKPVPLGSGLRELGRGRHGYLKTNAFDGSMVCLRFETREAAERAMAIGMAADAASAREYLGVA